MIKRRIIATLAGFALLLSVAGSAGIAADTLGFETTPPAHACSPQGNGGC